MADPFDASKIELRSGGRLLGRRRREAGAAVEALLAGASRIADVSHADVEAACRNAGVDSPLQVRREFKALYARFLDYCFDDRKLSTEESSDLDHLKTILQLADSDVASVQDDVAIGVYGSAVAEVLEDLKIDPEEAEFLRRLREDLRLSEAKAERLLEEGAQEARSRAHQHATAADDVFIGRRPPAGDFTGRSVTTIEDAVNDALGKAALAIPRLQWFEVTQISGYVDEASASQWYVILQAGVPREE